MPVKEAVPVARAPMESPDQPAKETEALNARPQAPDLQSFCSKKLDWGSQSVGLTIDRFAVHQV